MKETDLFGGGVPYEEDFVVKAHLRVPVRPHSSEALQGVHDTLAGLYEECAANVRHSFDSALARKSSVVEKAAAAPITGSGLGVKQPGIRGGKWWRDKEGTVRYGKPPQGEKAEILSHDEVRDHLKKFKPTTPQGGSHAEVINHARDNSSRHSMTKNEIDFMDWWHRDGIRHFVEGYKNFHLDDIHGDLDVLRLDDLDAGPMAIEEAILNFFKDQDWGDGVSFESKVRPLLENSFGGYQEVLENPATQDTLKRKSAATLGRWFSEARTAGTQMPDSGTEMSSAIDSGVTVTRVLNSLASMRLMLQIRDDAERGAYSPNEELLSEGKAKSGLLVQDGVEGKMAALTSAQLMLLYVASGLNSIWNPVERSYFSDAGVPATKLGKIASRVLSNKSGLGLSVGVLQRRLDEVITSVADHLNHGMEM